MASANHPDLMSHYPSKEDFSYCKKHSSLIAVKPTQKNHSDYYKMACSLWQIGRLQDAEKMFLKIVESKAPYYTGAYDTPSDVQGDTTTNSYDYGGHTSVYKNGACQYLTKIYIEEKKFDEALKYITLADKKYTLIQRCGTGIQSYQEEINDLYIIIYEGLGKYDSIIQMLLPRYLTYSNKRLIRALKKVYTPSEILSYLKIAENSIASVVDNTQSTEPLEINVRVLKDRYPPGTVTMNLFGKVVLLPKPNLKNSAIATRELFIKEFKSSDFYTALVSD